MAVFAALVLTSTVSAADQGAVPAEPGFVVGGTSADAAPRGGDSATSDICDIQVGIYVGKTFCGWPVAQYVFTDGRNEVFIVGVDNAVWHIWQRWNGDNAWSGWFSLGGRASYGVWGSQSSPVNRPIIFVVGVDGNYWCNQFVPETVTWTDWHRC